MISKVCEEISALLFMGYKVSCGPIEARLDKHGKIGLFYSNKRILNNETETYKTPYLPHRDAIFVDYKEVTKQDRSCFGAVYAFCKMAKESKRKIKIAKRKIDELMSDFLISRYKHLASLFQTG